MKNQYLTANQAMVIRDLALTMLQKPGHSRAAVLARMAAGNLNDLEPPDYRTAMISLIKFSPGSSLDVIGEVVDLPRATIEYSGGRSPETDASYAERLIAEICPQLWNRNAKLVGVSLRTDRTFTRCLLWPSTNLPSGKSVRGLSNGWRASKSTKHCGLPTCGW